MNTSITALRLTLSLYLLLCAATGMAADSKAAPVPYLTNFWKAAWPTNVNTTPTLMNRFDDITTTSSKVRFKLTFTEDGRAISFL